MLSWSAESTARTIDFAGLVGDQTEVGIRGGRELLALSDAAVGNDVDDSTLDALASAIGEAPAVRAAAVAGAFELYNRIVDAAGLPVGKAAREAMRGAVDTLGLDAFPHATHGL